MDINSLRYLEKSDFFKEKFLLKNRPLHCTFELTYKCNLRCRHCFRVEEEREELSTSEVYRILEELAEEGCLKVGFTGGEIFTRSDCIEILEYARKLKFVVTLLTNATLLTPRIVKILARLNIYHIQISFYGPNEELHDQHTGVNGSFERVIEGLKLLLREKLPVTINCLLTRYNFPLYRELLDFFGELKVPYQFDPYVLLKRDGSKSNLSFRLSEEQLEAYFKDRYVPLKSQDSEVSQEAMLSLPHCKGGHSMVAITPYGDVLPCNLLRIKIGNLRSQFFHEIWNTSLILESLRSIEYRDLPICSRCKFLTFCGRCAGNAYHEDGDLLGPSKEACRIAEVLNKIEGRDRIPASRLL
jgi:radical SAM protein with 4Fe4S-binding SPASM domain